MPKNTEETPWTQSSLPGVLGKACDDTSWLYAVELKSGRIYLADGATDLGGGWLMLHEYTGQYNQPCSLQCLFHEQPRRVPERGLTIPISEIRWMAEEIG